MLRSLLSVVLVALPLAAAAAPARAQATDHETASIDAPAAATQDAPQDAAQGEADTQPKSADPAATDPSERDPGAAPAAQEDAAPPAPRTVVDEQSELAYQRCNALVEGDPELGLRCFEDVVRDAPGTSGALQAAAALFVMRAHLAAPSVAPPASSTFEIPAGRLGVAVASGLFGAWNAIAGGVIVAAASAGAIAPPALILGTGGAAIVLGAASGVGGYLLADKLSLDEGAARLAASGLVWGTTLGVPLAFIVTMSARPSGAAGVAVPLLVVLASGYVGGGSALLASTQLTHTEAQVGLINSGGLLGGLWGISLASLAPMLAYATPSSPGIDPRLIAALFAAPTVAGLAAGAVGGRFVQMTWGEVLICDLGGVLGVIGGGALLFAAGNALGTGTLLAPAIGGTLGYAATMGGVHAWRAVRGAPSSSSASSSGASSSGASSSGAKLAVTPTVMVDRAKELVPGVLARVTF